MCKLYQCDIFLKKAYVNMWLRVKQQCSGYPQGIVTEAEKDAYVEDYFKVQGIRLDKASISKNPGLRLVAKLYLNRLVTNGKTDREV